MAFGHALFERMACDGSGRDGCGDADLGAALGRELLHRKDRAVPVARLQATWADLMRRVTRAEGD